jgi:hypothetical protein
MMMGWCYCRASVIFFSFHMMLYCIYCDNDDDRIVILKDVSMQAIEKFCEDLDGEEGIFDVLSRLMRDHQARLFDHIFVDHTFA